MTPTKDMLDRIAAEEAELVLEKFDEDDAWKLGNLLYEEGRRLKVPIVIDIRREGRILFHVSLAGTVPDNDEWVRRKSNVCFRFGKSSLAFCVSLALAGRTIEERYAASPAEYATSGGAFPIRVRGAGLVACATVSGLAQEEDHALVVDCLRKLKG